MSMMRTSSFVMLWLLCALLFSLPLGFCDQLLSFGLTGSGGDPCLDECTCYNWETIDIQGYQEKRFTVNCTGMKYGLFQGIHVPKNLPFNTTDLTVSEYLLGTLNIESFPNQEFPLNPMFLSVSLENCHIDFLSADTFQGSSFISIKNISLNHNSIELLMRATFWHLPYVENITIYSNHLRRVQSEAFRNLPKVHSINLSHNSISEIEPGALDNLPLLEVLDLSYNWLTSIPKYDILQLPSLRILNLKGNFWNCSCTMSWILELNRSVLVEPQAVCLYPLNLNGTAMQHLTIQDFLHCFDNGSSLMYLYTMLLPLCLIIVIYCMFPYLKQSNIKIVGQIEFDSRNVIGPNVFRGKLRRDKRHVAIKRLPKLSKESCNELRILLHMAEKGPANNVIQYLWFEEESMFTYIALELCEGDLANAVANHGEEVIPYLTPQNCLLQITHGLNYVHQLKIQHRDIKPQNILWKRSGANSKVRFVISDFDLGHYSDDISYHKSMYGTLGWTAPELWNYKEGERTCAVDIFPLGCVFYYVLTMGGHPFGAVTDLRMCQNNIGEGNFSASLGKMNECCSAFVSALATDVIRKMIQHKGSDRPEACVILNHPLLWNDEMKWKFFHKIGNFMEDKNPSVNRLKTMLERGAASVFEGSWMEKLEKPVRSDVQGFKKQSREICGLLRVIRNKVEHFRHLGEELKEIYLGSPEGVVQYYNEHFPTLLMYVYCIEQEWAKTLHDL